MNKRSEWLRGSEPVSAEPVNCCLVAHLNDRVKIHFYPSKYSNQTTYTHRQKVQTLIFFISFLSKPSFSSTYTHIHNSNQTQRNQPLTQTPNPHLLNPPSPMISCDGRRSRRLSRRWRW
ncbi:hypothetical protein Hanom_Chr12g01170191 [Helianthus anomalus]